MKKILFLLVLSFMGLSVAQAQYRIYKGELFLNESKIPLIEAKAVMTDISGVDFSEEWEKYYTEYKGYRISEILAWAGVAGSMAGIALSKGGFNSIRQPENGIKKSVLGMEILTFCFLGFAAESHVGKKAALSGMQVLVKGLNGRKTSPVSLDFGSMDTGWGLTIFF